MTLLGVVTVAVQQRRVKFQKTRSTKNRPALRRVKRHSCRFSAFGTRHFDFDPLSYAGLVGVSDGGQTLILRLLTVFAALRRVLKELVAEKGLFAGAPNEVLRTIDTLYRRVR